MWPGACSGRSQRYRGSTSAAVNGRGVGTGLRGIRASSPWRGPRRLRDPRHGATIIRPGGSSMRPPSQPELYRPRLTYSDQPYGSMLDRPVLLHPEREAVSFRDVSLTFRELDGLVN